MDIYVDLAKKAVESFILKHKEIIVPKGLPPEIIKKRAGVFVTIFNGSDLRGCIGTYIPCWQSIAEEIIKNAIAACSRDFRFLPISPAELPKLLYEVSVLSEPHKVEDINKLDPGKDGVIVKCDDGRCGLLLPGIPGVEKVADQIAIACAKGAIDVSRDKFFVHTFTIEKHT